MVAEQPFRSTHDGVKEWNLLSLAYKDAVGSRCAAWRVITSTEQKEKFKGKEQLVLHAREHVAKVEDELQKIRDGILALMDKELIPSPATDELKVFYYKMKGDYYSHLAEVATGETKSKADEDVCVAYAKATKIAEKDLVVTHPVRLAMALSSLDDVSVVAQRQIPMDQTVQKTVEISQLQCIDEMIDGPVMQVEHVPQSHVAEKSVEIPRRIGKFGRIRNLSSENQRERSTDITKVRRMHIPSSRWYSKVVRKRLRIPRTRSVAGTNRKERRSQWRISRRTGRVSTDRIKQKMTLKPVPTSGRFKVASSIVTTLNLEFNSTCRREETFLYSTENALTLLGQLILIWMCYKQNWY